MGTNAGSGLNVVHMFEIIDCNERCYLLNLTALKEAPVAQLDRASVYGTEGLGFESLLAHYPKTKK
jgi:hypothetical protein